MIGIFTAAAPGPQAVHAQTTIYVDQANSSDTKDGDSWATAYTSLHDALADPAATGASASDTEIWIAEGAYTPTDDPDITETDRDTSFVVTGNQDGLHIYGGFESGDAFADRSPADHPVVLSGDIDENDSDTTATGVTPTADDIEGENSFHVLVFNGGGQYGTSVSAPVTGATVLDGVTITGGDAGFSASFPAGGGLYCDGYLNECSPTIRNATFSGNTSDGGGAIYNNGIGGTSSPAITNATFSGNSADRGGAILNDGSTNGTSSPTLTEAIFSNNSANDGGGALYNNGYSGGTSSPQITNATFSGNVSFTNGGAIFNDDRQNGTSNPTITNASFIGNSAGYNGGAISNGGDPTITNASFIGNSADENGGAISNGGTPTITNTTFTGNSAGESGGAIFNGGDPTINNTILWENSASSLFGEDEVENDGGSPSFAHSIVQASGGSGSDWDSNLGTDEGGNIDADPQFADVDGPDDSLGTEDDDVRLQGPGSGGGPSPAIDAGDNSVISAGEDLTGNARKIDVSGVDDTGDGTAPIVDIGAYESTGAPLPVELASFDAQMDGETVRLSWTTASEITNAGFRIQRRVGARERGGGGAWTTVGKVEGAGTTSEAQDYRFTDGDLPYPADALTYRLKQVDTDGSAQFSKTITVERGIDEVQLLGTYPNPAQQQATVRYALPEKQDVEMGLYDVLGRQVRTVVSGEQDGRHKQRLDVSGLPSGVYFLRLRAGGETRTQKLTIAR